MCCLRITLGAVGLTGPGNGHGITGKVLTRQPRRELCCGLCAAAQTRGNPIEKVEWDCAQGSPGTGRGMRI